MGLYLQTPQPVLKAAQLEQLMGAERIERPKEFSDVPQDKYLLCVVENATFDAAGVAYCEKQFIEFALPDDPMNPFFNRNRTWMLIDKEKVHEQHPNLPNIAANAPATPRYLLEEAFRYGILS